MNRIAKIASLAALALLAAACGEPAKGHCKGTLGGRSFEADIDAQSEYRVVQRQVCTESNNKMRWAFSYGEGALQVGALSAAVSNSSLSSRELTLPPPFESASFEEWTVLAPQSSVLAPGGSMTLPNNIDLSDNVFGSFLMKLEDGSTLECTFSLPKGPDEGGAISCPDESSASSHHDWDWDD